MAGITNESLDALLERKGVRTEIRQQVRDKGFSSVIHLAGAIAEDELAEWFMHSTPSSRPTATTTAASPTGPRSRLCQEANLVCTSAWPFASFTYTHSYGLGCSG